MKVLTHLAVCAAAVFLLLGIPGLALASAAGRFDREADAVGSATVPLPEQPTGVFYVLMKESLRTESRKDWEAFFSDQEVGVIMEDISCLVMDSDVSGFELAQRYQLRLAEHQMTIRTENPLMVVSKAERGVFDTIVISADMADAYGFSPERAGEDTLVIVVRGGQEGD